MPAAGGHFAPCAAQWVAAMSDAIEQFRNALADVGVILAAGSQIIADGQLHRARAADDKAGALSIWYNFHPDAPCSGVAGNWRTGARLTWCAKRMQSLTTAERETLRLRIEQDRARAQAETARRHKEAAARALRIWSQAEPASPGHPYLTRKGVAVGIARQRGDMLILPVTGFDGALRGVQAISPTGEKRFTKGMQKQGAFIRTDGMPSLDARPLWIAEGWATACTLSALQPNVCTIAACDCGNLASVATEARRRWPALDIVVCPDFDAVGRQKGQEAAIAARARILPPPATVPPHCTDWNDIQAAKRQGVPSC